MADFKTRFQGNKDVVVTDAGDTISLPRNTSFLRKLQTAAEEYAVNSEKVREMDPSEVLDALIESTQKTLDWFDSAFGAGTSDMVFGEGCVPLPDTIVDFFDYLIEQADINSGKYSPNRKGAKK